MKVRWLALIVGLTLAAGACGGGTKGQQGGKSSTLIIADPATPSTLDVEFASTDQSWTVGQSAYRHLIEWGVTQFTDGAASVDLQNPPIGGLAKSWEASPDGKHYTFHLRSDAKSPFGNTVSTDDVVWSFQRAKELKSVGLFVFGLGSIDAENPTTPIDERSFTINLSTATPVFAALFAIPVFAPVIYDSKEVKKHTSSSDPWARDWLAKHTAGYGPYQVEKFQPGTQVVWVANPNFYGRPLPLKRIIWREVPDESTRLSLIKSGAVDIATFLGPRSRQEAASSSGVKVLGTQGNLGLILGLNMKSAPFDKRAVRQAVADAVPVNDIIKNVYLGDQFAVDFRGYVPMTYPFAHQGPFDYWPYSYDLNKAKGLMASAGVTSANVTLDINATRPDQEQAAILIQQSLAQIGLKVQIDKLTPAKYQEQYFGRKAQMVLVQDAAWVVDPAYVTVNYFDPGSAGVANWVNYDNTEGAQLMEQAYSTADPTQRLQLAGEAYKVVVDDAPWSFYIGTGLHVVARKNVGGFVWRTDNLLDFLYLKKTA